MGAATAQPSGPDEAPRDQSETTFTQLLRRVVQSDPRVLAAVVVDGEGECVDYCSTLSPFEAKVCAAHYQIVFIQTAERLSAHWGGLMALEVNASAQSVLLRRVDSSYTMLTVCEGQELPAGIVRSVSRAISAFRREAGLVAPTFEARLPEVRVRMREALGWPFAPDGFLLAGQTQWTPVQAVLGRWYSVNEELLCFRVRTPTGQELTLTYDEELDRWEVVAEADMGAEGVARFLADDAGPGKSAAE